MKKIICLLLLITLMNTSTFSAFASETVSNFEIKYLEDGSYIITYIEDVNADNFISPRVTSTTKSKTFKYYNSNNVALWYVTVTGTFNYGDGMSRCIRSTVSAGSYASDWQITDTSSSHTAHTAIATATAKQYFLGVVIDTVEEEVRLSCSPTGEFS